jgi:hypothetical protein
MLKTNDSEYSCETRPIRQTSGHKPRCQTPVSNLTPGIHTGLTPVLTRQNSTRDSHHMRDFAVEMTNSVVKEVRERLIAMPFLQPNTMDGWQQRISEHCRGCS